MKQDIILVTIDALRYDSPPLMPNTKEYFGSEGQTEAITSGAATNWVFPGILSGSYYTNAYNDSGTLRDQLTTLPDVLGEQGYATGAFLGYNPYLYKWQNRFDEFWNGGISNDTEDWYSNPLKKWLNRGYRTVLLKKRVPGRDVIKRAQTWYHNQSKPRFLWVHLMEPHKPYYPGLKAGNEIGLLPVYRSIINLQRLGDNVSNRDVDIQRNLYRKCVSVADKLISDLLNSLEDDNTVMVLGDHGEEFDHGHLGHERLYDECVRVPLFFKNFSGLIQSGDVRQIDIPATLLRDRSIDVPDSWDGQRVTPLEDNPALMLTPEPSAELFHAGIRTDSKKLIYTFDRDTGQKQRTEYYNLSNDPTEHHNLSQQTENRHLESSLSEFITTHEHALSMNAETGVNSATVEERLQNLGYK